MAEKKWGRSAGKLLQYTEVWELYTEGQCVPVPKDSNSAMWMGTGKIPIPHLATGTGN